MAIQIYGGHSYICERGVEQNWRDYRVATLHEGTIAIQALDLLNRKVVADQGQVLQLFLTLLKNLASEHEEITVWIELLHQEAN